MSSFCNRMTNIFLKKNIIDEEEREVYQYGLEILFSTVLGALVILAIGFITNQLAGAVIYYFIFATLRVYCGGYHASTYLKCKLSFAVTYIIVLSLAVMIRYLEIPPMILLPGATLELLVIYRYAPIENEKKPLNETQKKKHRKLSLMIYCLWTGISMVCYYFETQLFVMIHLTLFSVVILMLISIFQKKRRET